MPALSLSHIANTRFDVAIIGGGINGASLYHALTHSGHRVLLVDRGDFACATSQASTMMIWGGLLYMKDWELGTVCQLSASRDALIADQPAEVQPKVVRYVPTVGGRSRPLVHAALYAYWLLGLARRRRPTLERIFKERTLLRHGSADAVLSYEEAGLRSSDARFVLSWILSASAAQSAALNYCSMEAVGFDTARRLWRLDLRDTLTGLTGSVDAGLVINCAGGWTDSVNALAGVTTPYRHLHSRGVSIALPRHKDHHAYLVFDNGIAGNAMTYAPWGPVALWGSTDTIHESLDEARAVESRDIAFLLSQLNQHLATPLGLKDIVSVRCGVRPVAVTRTFRPRAHAQSLSRRHRVHRDRDRPWISVYGGKLSGCTTLAAEVSGVAAGVLDTPRPSNPRQPSNPCDRHACSKSFLFPSLPVLLPSPAFSAQHEQCRTVEDYVRRRTNIAQWIPRGGFGRHDEHAETLHEIGLAIHQGNHTRATDDLTRYRATVDRDWRILEGANHP